VAAFNTSVSAVLANAALITEMGGTPSHDSSEDKFSCTLRCHDENGELYPVALSRDTIRFSSFEDDTIRTGLDTWADAIPALHEYPGIAITGEDGYDPGRTILLLWILAGL
jgi:hypothetical protein